MSKPETLKDLLAEGHISKSEIRAIAKTIFDGVTKGAGPEGYLITAAKFDDLPEGTKQHIVKAILEFKVENVFEHGEELALDHSNADSVLAENDPEDD